MPSCKGETDRLFIRLQEELRARNPKYNYKTLKTTGETTAAQPEVTTEPSNPPPASVMNAMPPQPMMPASAMAPPPGMCYPHFLTVPMGSKLPNINCEQFAANVRFETFQ